MAHSAVHDAAGHGVVDPRDVVARPPVRTRAVVWRFLVMALLLGLVCGGIYWFNGFRDQKIAEFFAGMKPPPAPVVMAEAKAEPVPVFLSGIGTLAAVHQVTVAPEIGGRVAQILFQPGAAVRAGDSLVQLNDRPEQADLVNYRAQAKLAELNLARSKQLVGKQFTPQATVDQNQALLDQASAGIARSQALINQKLVRAPFDGVLGVRQIDLGQYLNAGAAIVTLTDLGTLYVNFTLPEQTRGALKPGQTVRVKVDAFPDRTFEARITTVEPQISAEMRAIKVQATMDNADHMLLPGMFARAEVVLPPRPDIVTVPETAVDYTLYGDSVFVVHEDKDAEGKPALTVKRAFVKTGERFDNKVAILTGLKPGDRVAASGQNRLNDGSIVVSAESSALNKPAQTPIN